MTPVTLASKSSARQMILKNAGVAFEAVSPGVDEDAAKAALLAEQVAPRDVADALAEMKAVKVSTRRSGLVIGADQTLDLKGRLIDKVDTLDQARERLLELRGQTHKLHSAVVVARAKLTGRPFSDAWLDAYIERRGEALLWSVGCYELESEGVQLFSQVDGDYFAILGLPLISLLDFLRLHGALGA
jgi:septum formation protein